jgi:hypothetical protein
MPLYVIKQKVKEGQPTPKPRLVKADRRNQVEIHLLKDFDIERADAEEAVTLGADGVKVENVE